MAQLIDLQLRDVSLHGLGGVTNAGGLNVGDRFTAALPHPDGGSESSGFRHERMLMAGLRVTRVRVLGGGRKRVGAELVSCSTQAFDSFGPPDDDQRSLFCRAIDAATTPLRRAA